MVRVGGYGLIRGIELGAATSPATVIGPLTDIINGEKQSGMGEDTVMSLYLSAPSNHCFPSSLPIPVLVTASPSSSPACPSSTQEPALEASLSSPQDFLLFFSSFPTTGYWLLAMAGSWHL